MDHFVVSARKYRPATFNTVVGQSSITNTLKNAIKSNHLAQAFLFCGPRGVGKTTCARILAKTINCFNVTENTEACNTCESCLSFNSGQSLNVYELDAASNNSVDDIRSLVDQVRFAPQLGKFKVYIIDEVHMLSTSAFNAFLKTLEEPPAHAIFILATTEKHKIIPTILSRCQIFDFNRIQIDDIAQHLAFIANSEGITADTDALHIISQKADGALRDACSLFDQIVSFAGNHLTYKAVIDNLNILDYDYYFKLTGYIFKEDISQSLLLLNEVLSNGFDGHNFVAGFAEHIRNLMVVKDEVTIQLLEVSENVKNKYKEQSALFPAAQLLQFLTIINRSDIQYKSSKNPRLLVELMLMQLCSVNRSGDPGEKKNDISLEPRFKAAFKTSASRPASGAPGQPSIIIAPAVRKASTPQAKGDVNVNTTTISGYTKAHPLAEVKETTQEISYDEKSSPFSYEDLKKVWVEYASLAEKAGRHSMSATLLARKPELKENFIIEFSIDNMVQENEMKAERSELLSYLRSRLNNYKLDIITSIKQLPAEEKKYFTQKEKFERLAELYPVLNKLKQQLDLDID